MVYSLSSASLAHPPWIGRHGDATLLGQLGGALRTRTGTLDLPIPQFQAQTVYDTNTKVKVGTHMHDVEDVSVAPTRVSQLLHVCFGHRTGGEGQLLRVLQHRILGFC